MSSDYRGLSSIPDFPLPQLAGGGLPAVSVSYNGIELPVPVEEYKVWNGGLGEWVISVSPGVYSSNNASIKRLYRFFDENDQVIEVSTSPSFVFSVFGKEGTYVQGEEVAILGDKKVSTVAGRYAYIENGLPAAPSLNAPQYVRLLTTAPPFSISEAHDFNTSFTGSYIYSTESVWVINGQETTPATPGSAITAGWGDRVRIKKSATDLFGQTTSVLTKEVILNKQWYDIWQQSGNEVKAYQDASEGLRPSCELFSSVNHVTGQYTWNDNLWLPAAKFRKQLSAMKVATWANDTNYLDGTKWSESFGGILITPRHILGARHSYYGGNPPFGPANPNGTPWTLPLGFIPGTYPDRRLRFLLPDNTTYEVRQIADANPSFIYPVGHPNHLTDLSICVLEEDVPEELGILPLFSPSFALLEPDLDTGCLFNWPNSSVSRGYLYDSFFPEMLLTQAEGRVMGPGEQLPPTGVNARALNGSDQKAMLACFSQRPYQKDGNYGILDNDSHYSKFLYHAWSGDSGRPELALVNDQLYVRTIAVTASSVGDVFGSFPGNYTDVINDLILWAERRAEAQYPTLFKGYSGYRVRPTTLNELESGMPPQWWLPGN
jgi:hypothetical protein